jgi:hypothetical protein
MAELVLILGASASKEAGAPLMADFLDKAEDLLLAGKTGRAEELFKKVFGVLASLKQVPSQNVSAT